MQINPLSELTLVNAPLQSYSMTDVGRRLGDVKRAAQRAPVVLTTRGKPDLVVLTAEAYEELVRYWPTPVRADELEAHELELIATQTPGSGPAPYPPADDTTR